MIKRLVSIFMFTTLGLLFLLYATAQLFAVFMAFISSICLYEALFLMLPEGEMKGIYLQVGLLLGGVVAFSLPFVGGDMELFFLFFVMGSLLFFLFDLFMRRGLEEGYSLNGGIVVRGFVYVVVSLGFSTAVRYLPNGREGILFLFVITFLRDFGSAAFGMLFKVGHPIAPMINPRKTVEGAMVAFLIGVLVTFLYQSVWPEWGLGLGAVQLIILIFLLSMAGQVGDLVESLMKRTASVIDSSQLIPAQGGFLDSFDGLIFTGPLFYCLIRFWS